MTELGYGLRKIVLPYSARQGRARLCAYPPLSEYTAVGAAVNLLVVTNRKGRHVGGPYVYIFIHIRIANQLLYSLTSWNLMTIVIKLFIESFPMVTTYPTLQAAKMAMFTMSFAVDVVEQI